MLKELRLDTDLVSGELLRTRKIHLHRVVEGLAVKRCTAVAAAYADVVEESGRGPPVEPDFVAYVAGVVAAFRQRGALRGDARLEVDEGGRDVRDRLCPQIRQRREAGGRRRETALEREEVLHGQVVLRVADAGVHGDGRSQVEGHVREHGAALADLVVAAGLVEAVERRRGSRHKDRAGEGVEVMILVPAMD